MSSIKVYEVSGDTRPLNAISVWDASLTGTRPLNSIPVWKDTNEGDRPLNSIQVKIVDKALNAIPVWFNGGSEPGPGPTPSLPPYTLRLKYKEGVTPTFDYGTGVLVDATNNIWDLTYENSSWFILLNGQTDLLEVLAANTSGVNNMACMFMDCSSLTTVSLFDTSSVTQMNSMFNGCTSLTTVPLFDTSNVTTMETMFINCTSLISVPLFNTSSVTNMYGMFEGCSSLTSIPLFNTSNVTDMYAMFQGCINVESGALALYQQASTQTTPPSEHQYTFYECGSNTQTGAAELAQIPSSWGGTAPEPPQDNGWYMTPKFNTSNELRDFMITHDVSQSGVTPEDWVLHLRFPLQYGNATNVDANTVRLNYKVSAAVATDIAYSITGTSWRPYTADYAGIKMFDNNASFIFSDNQVRNTISWNETLVAPYEAQIADALEGMVSYNNITANISTANYMLPIKNTYNNLSTSTMFAETGTFNGVPTADNAQNSMRTDMVLGTEIQNFHNVSSNISSTYFVLSNSAWIDTVSEMTVNVLVDKSLSANARNIMDNLSLLAGVKMSLSFTGTNNGYFALNSVVYPSAQGDNVIPIR